MPSKGEGDKKRVSKYLHSAANFPFNTNIMLFLGQEMPNLKSKTFNFPQQYRLAPI